MFSTTVITPVSPDTFLLASFGVSFNTNLNLVAHLVALIMFSSPPTASTMSVSYTHLDVYKRQATNAVQIAELLVKNDLV